jgi:hypothetical protein
MGRKIRMTIDERIKTDYGWRAAGESKFVIVAPHGAGDDEETHLVAEEIARIMGAVVVVNRNYKRETCNLNDISDVATNEKKRDFFADVDQSVEEAREYSANEHDGKERAIVIYIHGMKNRGDVGVDVGIGAKWNVSRGKYQGARYHPEAGQKKGKVRANIAMTREMRVNMDEKLRTEKGKRAWIGKVFAAWDEDNGIQHHAGTDDYSMQIEISRDLRDDPKYIAGVIAESLQEAYKKL